MMRSDSRRRAHAFRTGLFAALLFAVAADGASVVKMKAGRDTWVSSYRTERDGNMGRVGRLKLKGHQELAFVDFDVAAIRGRIVKSAALCFRSIRSERELRRLGLPLTRWDALRKIGVSTVAGQWVEGLSERAYQTDERGHGACFNWASYGRRPWSWKGSKAYDVIMGNGHTLDHHAELARLKDGWWRVSLPPDLVHALVAGVSVGLCVMDESGQTRANNYVYSREAKGSEPYLVVRVGGSDAQPPASPRDVRLDPLPSQSTLASGAAAMAFRVPDDAFAYSVTVNGRTAPRWQIPFAADEGAEQRIALMDLPPAAEISVSIRAVDRAGNASKPVRVRGRTSAALPRPPSPPKVAFPKPSADPPSRSGKMRVWAFPELSKVDPASGKLLFEPRADTYRRSNAVWDAAARRIALSAARNEVVAFQLAVELIGRALRDVRIEVSPLRNDGATIPGSNVRVFRAWYVQENGWQPEYAIPLRKPFSIPGDDGRIPDQRNQTIAVDMHVPHDAAPGDYTGTVTVAARGVEPIRLDLVIHVSAVTIPDELRFTPELNCYKGPGRAGDERWFAAHRLAHAHRCTINRLPYSQSGRAHDDLVPALKGSGAEQRVRDWTGFDKNVGPLLDGSAFTEGPGAGVPVNRMYLPFHEHWPNPIDKHYAYRDPAHGKGCVIQHAMLGPIIERAFTREYADGFKSVLRDFAQHLSSKGWHRTMFQVYLNNKFKYRITGRGTSWWLLDEPAYYDDWMALRWYSQLVHEAIDEETRARIVFRGDISRPQWQFRWMDGLMEIMYVNNGLFDKVRRCRIMKERMPCELAVYGSCNRVGEANLQSTAWCVKAYLAGADGVVPWQTLAGDRAFDKADGNGLVVVSDRFGEPATVSFRVKALRRGAQLVELLRLLADRRGWTRDQAGALVAQIVPLESTFRQQFLDEAASVEFGDMSASQLVALERTVLRLLAE